MLNERSKLASASWTMKLAFEPRAIRIAGFAGNLQTGNFVVIFTNGLVGSTFGLFWYSQSMWPSAPRRSMIVLVPLRVTGAGEQKQW